MEVGDPELEREVAPADRGARSWPERLPDRMQGALMVAVLVGHVTLVAFGPDWLWGPAIVLGPPLFGQMIWSFDGGWRPALLWTGPLALWNTLGLYIVPNPLGDLMLAAGIVVLVFMIFGGYGWLLDRLRDRRATR